MTTAPTLSPPRPSYYTPRRKSPYTPADLLERADGFRYELVDGKLVRRQMSTKSSWVGMNVAGELIPFVRANDRGFILGSDAGLEIFEGTTNVRSGDVVFISKERMGGRLPEDGHAHVCPDLIVEVNSRNDRLRYLKFKIEQYFGAGVREVWLVDPDTRTVEVRRPDGHDRTYRGTDILDGGDVLPGFSCPIATFFGPVTD